MPAKKYFTKEEWKAARYADKVRHRKSNPESRKEESVRYYKKNKISIRARDKNRYMDDPKKHIDRSAKYSRKNPLKSRATRKRYSDKNPHVRAMVSMRYRHRKIKSTHPEIDEAKVILFINEAKIRTNEFGVIHHVDHIVPLSKGGWHHHDNLQVLPRRLNCSGGKGCNPFWLSPSPVYKDWRDVPRKLWPAHLAPKYIELIEQNKGKSIRWDAAA